MGFSWILGEDLTLDLGTSNTLIYSKRKDGKIMEPSVVAVDLNNYEIVAVGEKAKNMEGKTPDNIITLAPIKGGKIINFEIAQVMLTNLLKKAKSSFSVFHPKVHIAISSGISEVDRRAIEDCVIYSGARSIEFIPSAVASAIGMGLPALEPSGSIVANIGGGTVDVSLVSLGGVVASKFVDIGGDSIDYDIINIVKNKYDLMIDKETAEFIKINLSSFITSNITNSLSIFGRDIN
ncbi:MAG: rod shape-determining protein, partial [Parvimonas micra]|nr:rod shape-determining protein [Parvimonas micra]